MLRVALLVFPGSLSSSVALPLEMLAAAEQFSRSRNRHQPRSEFVLAGSDASPVSMLGGLQIEAQQRLDDIDAVDLVFLPSLWRNPQRFLEEHNSTVHSLKRLALLGADLCAVGTGSYLLAATGLLDGRAGTTHWHYLDEFAHLFPRVQLQRQHLITQADHLYCAGSVNSVADLMVYFIERHFDRLTARHVESQFSPEIRRPYDSYGFVHGHPSAHSDELVMEAQNWLHEHLAEPLQLVQIARRVDLAPRSLQRRFHMALGVSPMQYLQRIRLDLARDLLRHSNLGIGDIAARCGCQDASRFSALFRRQMEQTPQAYRRQVRRKLFASSAEHQKTIATH